MARRSASLTTDPNLPDLEPGLLEGAAAAFSAAGKLLTGGTLEPGLLEGAAAPPAKRTRAAWPPPSPPRRTCSRPPTRRSAFARKT